MAGLTKNSLRHCNAQRRTVSTQLRASSQTRMFGLLSYPTDRPVIAYIYEIFVSFLAKHKTRANRHRLITRSTGAELSIKARYTIVGGALSQLAKLEDRECIHGDSFRCLSLLIDGKLANFGDGFGALRQASAAQRMWWQNGSRDTYHWL